MDAQATRQEWSNEAHGHERKTERLYGYGAKNYNGHHGGFLCFGDYEDEAGNTIGDFVEAAENLNRRVGRMAGLDRRSVVLDVACGYGPQDIFFHREFGCASIDAVDVTWEHVRGLEKRIRENGLEKVIRAHHGTATNLAAFKPETFSHVISIEGIAHFNTREMFLGEAYDLLKDGGVIAVTDYVMKRRPRTLAEHALIAAVPWLWHMPKENVVMPEDYRAAFVRAGFRNIGIESAGDRVIPGYFLENQRPETVAQMRKIRGVIGEMVGRVLDHAVYKAFTSGLCDYVYVRAEK